MRIATVTASLCCVACLFACHPTVVSGDAPAPTATPTTAMSPGASAATDVPQFEGMGHYSRPITTNSELAQRYFDQGMAFLHGFNHKEAIRSFEAAAAFDPDCAMAYFGVALASGPHINAPGMSPEQSQTAWRALTRARAATGASPVERQLIEALSTRYVETPPADRRPLDHAYAAAMRDLWRAEPSDADIGTWFAEALMDLRPWDLWTADGNPQPGTAEIVALLEQVMAMTPDLPLALHLYIHAVEASPEPGKADAAADRLRDLVPAQSHLQHMPSHIDVRRGRWAEAVAANQRAVEADLAYLELSPRQDFYRLYMAHNRHMLAYAAMMIGRSELAIEHMNQLVADIPAEWATANVQTADGYFAMPTEVLMRFGKWSEILAVPEFPPAFALSNALRHYARGVAFAATLHPAQARAELELMRAAAARIAEDAAFGNNTARAVAGVADKLLEGEVLYREGKVDAGIASLREAVAREDALAYDEPPGWIQPVRHALGAVLLAEKRIVDAELVYREDLRRLPENGWGLWGLARSLRLQKQQEEADRVDARFQSVWAGADIELHTSCMCLPGV